MIAIALILTIESWTLDCSMKSAQVLQLYAKGRRDFRGQNLRGQSFKGQNLSGADFSYADLQGTNFRGANLRDSQFRGVKAGLQKHWIAVLVGTAWLLSVLLGLALVLVSYFILLFFNLSGSEDGNTGWAALLLMITLVWMASRRGMQGGWEAIAGVIEIVIVGVIIGVISGLANLIVLLGTLAISCVLAGFAIAILFACAIAFAIAFAIAPRTAWLVSPVKVVTVAAIASGIAGYISGTVVALVIAGAALITFVFDYIGWRAIHGDRRYRLIHDLAVNLAATGGTCFRNADLTDADFSNAILNSTDLRQAKLARTCWRGVKKLNRVRLGNSYLQNLSLRELLTTGLGQNQNFNDQDLRGLNLQNANLAHASLIDANLSYANLQEANLSGAKLVRTKLSATNLNRTTLTGAYIENWGITLTTQLKRVRCDYLFLRFPSIHTSNLNPCRLPEDWNKTLEPQDFIDLIRLFLQNRQGIYASLNDLSLLNNLNVSASLTGFNTPEKTNPTETPLNLTQNSAFLSSTPSNTIPEPLEDSSVVQATQVPLDSQSLFSDDSNLELIATDLSSQNTAHNLPDILTEVVDIFQEFLSEIDNYYSAKTTAEQLRVAADIINQIEQDSTLKQSLIETLTDQNLRKLDQAIHHPIGYFVVTALRTWKNPE